MVSVCSEDMPDPWVWPARLTPGGCGPPIALHGTVLLAAEEGKQKNRGLYGTKSRWRMPWSGASRGCLRSSGADQWPAATESAGGRRRNSPFDRASPTQAGVQRKLLEKQNKRASQPAMVLPVHETQLAASLTHDHRQTDKQTRFILSCCWLLLQWPSLSTSSGHRWRVSTDC